MPGMIYTDHAIEIGKGTPHTHEGLTGAMITGTDVDHGDRVVADKYLWHYHAGGYRKVYLPTYIGNWLDHTKEDHRYPVIDYWIGVIWGEDELGHVKDSWSASRAKAEATGTYIEHSSYAHIGAGCQADVWGGINPWKNYAVSRMGVVMPLPDVPTEYEFLSAKLIVTTSLVPLYHNDSQQLCLQFLPVDLYLYQSNDYPCIGYQPFHIGDFSNLILVIDKDGLTTGGVVYEIDIANLVLNGDGYLRLAAFCGYDVTDEAPPTSGHRPNTEEWTFHQASVTLQVECIWY